jgi:hypothetical protein
MKAVEDTLVEALVTLENDSKKIQKTAGVEWIVSIFLNAT